MKQRTWTDDQLIKAIPDNDSFAAVALSLGMSRATNTDLRKRAIELQLDFSHFRKSGHKKKAINLLSSRKAIKHRLLQEGTLQYACSECGISSWRGKELPLDLEHIDGNRYNNEIDNLTLLCPNCHALTSSYRGKNRGKYKDK
jgi:hypothetical protein